jgi:serine protease
VPPTTVPPTTVPPTTVPPTTVPPTTDPAHTPGAPTGATATSGNGQATVSWTAPKDDGGLPIVGYLVIANGGEALAITEGAETTATVTGLTNGTSYTFTVIAFNEGVNDGSLESAASNAVTPSGPAASATTTTGTPTPSTTPAVVAGAGAAVIPVGAPDTGAGGVFNR